MVGLVLAAGSGSRLTGSFGSDVCKPLIEIAGKRLIEYSLENLFNLKVDRIIVVVGKHRARIEKEIGTQYKGVPVCYAVQEQPIGLVNAIAAALESIDGDTVLQLSDEIFVDSKAETVKLGDADFVCGITYENDAEEIKGNYSVALNEDGGITHCTEKPSVVNNNLKGTGFCVFSRECIAILKESYDEGKNVPCDLCDYINLLIERGLKGVTAEVAKREYNINTAADAERANAELFAQI
ncbi:MAG: NTP transferase domain-containing protein [Eubacterium sp.]|nr:NTP transferase domain-containing protein [Eubacterium sp.]